jgi:hypothetical protein
MLEGRVPRRIYSPAQQFDIPFGSGAVINLFADAHNLKVVAAPAVGSRVAARCVAHILFTVADCTDTEVFWQEAISALGAEEFHYGFEYMKASVIGVHD